MAVLRTTFVVLLSLSFTFGLFAKEIHPKGNPASPEAPVFEGIFNTLDFSVQKQNIMFSKQAMVWSDANMDTRIFGLDAANQEIQLDARGLRVEKVVYENLYFNIDLIVHIPASNDRKEISYEFIVYPGGNPKDISLDFASGYIRPGGEAFLIDEETESLRLTSPEGMQVSAGTDEQKVAADFKVKANKLQLETGDYEQSEVLTLVCKQL